MLQFDWLTQENQPDVTGNLMIYLHYAIIFGISLITVSLKFLHEKEADSIFTVCCLYAGIGLFYIGLAFATRYNKNIYRLKVSTFLIFLITTIIGFMICLLWHSFAVIVIISLCVVLLNAGYLSYNTITNKISF